MTVETFVANAVDQIFDKAIARLPRRRRGSLEHFRKIVAEETARCIAALPN
jgi:hypothetical protein